MSAFQAPQPGSISVPSQIRSLLSVFDILERHYVRVFTDRFGTQNYVDLLQILGKERMVDGRDYYHHESRGKLHPAVQVTSVANGTTGATATVTIAAGSHYNAGTQSPLRVGSVLAIQSSNIEGKIIAINKTVANAHTADVAPLKTTQAFNPAANDWLEIRGATEMGEASSAINPMINPTTKFTFSTTEHRDDYVISDRAYAERLEFDFNGQPIIYYKDMDEMERRYLNDREFKFIKGDILNNTTANATSVGMQGLVSQMTANAGTLTYTAGNLDIAKFHEVNREIRFNGGPSEYDWMCDIFSFQELQDLLFATYPNGALVYGNTNSDTDVKINYGFKSFRIDGVVHNLKIYDPFSPETVYGFRPSVAPFFRNYALVLPSGQGKDPQSGDKMFNVQLTYQNTFGKKQFAWETGAGASIPTTGTLQRECHMASIYGSEGYALNQAIILDGA